jgi:RNA polymerase sigma-70 factor (ECF subfamily)
MESSGSPRQFSTTLWTQVLRARDAGEASAGEALNALCKVYWFPIYGFCRSRGMQAAEAEDATQGFFAQFLLRGSLGRVNPEKGRFRSFLLTCLKHYLADEWDKGRAQRRGGAWTAVPLDLATAEELIDSTSADSPELAYDRRWARSLVDRVLGEVRQEFSGSGVGRLFAMLNGEELSPEGREWRISEIADLLGMKEDAVKYQARRMKQEFRQRLKREIARTVESPAETEAELRHLLSILR